MPRMPYVWEVQIRREVVDDEIQRLREIPYSIWRDLMSGSMGRAATGRDGRAYRLRVTSAYVEAPEGDIRVTVTLQSAHLRRRLLRDSFVITPDNRFTV